MNDFIKCFTGLQRNFGFCNISNGYTDPNTGKIKFNAGDYGWSGKAITEDEVKGLFSLWNDALATGDSKKVASRYAKKGVLLPTVSDVPRTGT